MAERVATIDLGSNSCVLLVLERRGGRLQRLDSRLEITRLSEGLDASKALAPVAIHRALVALDSFAAHARSLGVEQISALGTAALREASNAQTLIDAAAKRGVNLRAISGDEEAELSYASALEGVAPAAAAAMMIDVGGASTEFAWGAKGQLKGRMSLPIGSVRLHERLGLGVPASADDLEGLRSAIDEALSVLPPIEAMPVYAVAGTATSAAQLHLELMQYDPEQLDFVELSTARLSSMIADLAARPLAERQKRFGLPAGRADVLPAGLCILERAMMRWRVPRLIVRDRGVAWGEAMRLLASLG
jgi:exopolyphosphatase/guanosine-5'-triphosphate,3'-diphosphate pyrophosphatase